jgi:ionotropic glutamate receptor
MKQNKDVFVGSVEEGVEKVRKENYAYFLESSTNEYIRERNCDLIQIGGLLDSKSIFLF